MTELGKILSKTFLKGRWYLDIETKFGHRKIPQATYIWLQGNPAFLDIPKGYVIHHLDLDPLNDDISNLALMQRHHHTAYHWKHKTIQPEIRIDGGNRNHRPIDNVTKPKIFYRKDRNNFILTFTDKDAHKRVWVSSMYEKPFKTREDAQRGIDMLFMRTPETEKNPERWTFQGEPIFNPFSEQNETINQ